MSTRSLNIELALSASKFTSGMASVNSNIKLLKSDLANTKSDFNTFGNGMDNLKGQSLNLSGQIEEQRKKITLLNDAYEKAVKNSDATSVAAQKYERQLNYANAELNTMQGQLEKTNRNLLLQESSLISAGEGMGKASVLMTEIGKTTSTVGDALSKNVTLPLAAVGTTALTASIHFEDAFAGVEKTVDGTKEELKDLSDGIIDMSKEMPESAVKIAGVAEAAGQLGIKTSSILDFTKTMVMLGDSTNLSSEEAATGLARLANITQMNQGEFQNLGSTVVDLGNNFATTETEIVEMSLRLAGAGTQVGLSEPEILGMATTLSSLGIEAEMGGSAFSKMMVTMQLASESGGAATQRIGELGYSLRELQIMSANDSESFKKLADSFGYTRDELKGMVDSAASLDSFSQVTGQTADEFSQAFKDDAAGAIVSFIDGLQNCEDRGVSTIQVLDDMGISEVRLRDSLLRTAGAGDTLSEALDTGNKAWDENSALTTEANKRYETTASQLEILWNRVIATAMGFADEMLPALKNVVDGAGDFIKILDGLSDGQKTAIVTTGLFVAAAGPLLSVFGRMTSGLGNVVGGLGKFVVATGKAKVEGTGLAGVVGNLLPKFAGAAKGGGAMAGGIGAVTGSSALLVTGLGLLGGALAVGVAAWGIYQHSLDMVRDQNRELYESSQELLRQSDDIIKQSQDEKKAREEITKTTEAEAGMVKNLTDRLFEVIEKEGETLIGKEKIKLMVDELNGVIPDLALAYDGETTSLNLTKDAIYEKITAMQEEAKVAAYKEAYIEIAKKQVEIDGQIYQSQQLIKEAEAERIAQTKEATEIWEKNYEGKSGVVTLEEAIAAKTQNSNNVINEQKEKINALNGENQKLSDEGSFYMDKYQNSIENSVKKTTETTIEEGQKTINEVTKIPPEIAAAMEKGMTLQEATMRQASIEMFGPVTEEAKNKVYQSKDMGYNIAKETADGIEDGVPDITEASTNIAKASSEPISKIDWSEFGKWAAQGFGLGIGSMTDFVITAASNIGDAALRALGIAIEAKSPSRLTKELGKFFTEGYAIGIKDQDDLVIQSANAVGKLSTEALKGLDWYDLGKEKTNSFALGMSDKARLALQSIDAVEKNALLKNNGAMGKAVASANRIANYGHENMPEQTIILQTTNITYLDGKEIAKEVKREFVKQVSRDNINSAKSRGAFYV